MRPKKITAELKPLIAEDLKSMSRKEVMAKYGLNYQMLSREFGNKWRQSKGEIIVQAEASVS